MIIGKIILFLLLAALFGAFIAELSQRFRKFSLYLLYVGFVFAAFSVVMLLLLVLRSDFSCAYVAEYSSLSLPLIYKVSVLWAGQNGSFLVWIFIQTIVIISVVKKMSDHRVRLFSTAYLFSLVLIMLMYANPFSAAETAVNNGAGLNPVLVSKWMILHPPILFAGYSLCFIPFVLNLADSTSGNIRKKLTRRYALLSLGILGLGLVLGGVWAYETLGWGGFWGWDPVENASLVPWLFSLVLVHSCVLNRLRGNLLDAYPASSWPFVSVMAAVLCTRGGLFGISSVHSFSPNVVAFPLGVMTVVILGFSVYFTIKEYRRKNKIPTDPGFPYSIALLSNGLLTAYTVILIIATYLPVFIAGKNGPGSLAGSFYNDVSVDFTLALIIVLLVYRLYMVDLKSKIIHAFILALFISGGLILGSKGFILVSILLSCGVYYFFATAITLVEKTKRKNISGTIAHMGFALMISALAAQSVFGGITRIDFAKGETKTVYGLQLRFDGFQGNTKALFSIKKSNSVSRNIVIHISSNDSTHMTAPVIVRGVLRDIYLSIEGVITQDDIAILKKQNDKMDKSIPDTETVYISVQNKFLMTLIWLSFLFIISGSLLSIRKKI